MKNSFLKELRIFCRDPVWLFIIWFSVFACLAAIPLVMAIRNILPLFPFFWAIVAIFTLVFAIWVTTCKPK